MATATAPDSNPQGSLNTPPTGKLNPVGITFLTGAYKGQPLDMGIAVVEVNSDQTSEWTTQDGRSIRVGSTFKNVSPRSFTLKLQFYSVSDDVSPQVENCATLHEIDEESGTAPILLYNQGAIANVPVYCDAFRPHYQYPFPDKKGFHFAEVDLSFRMIGGKLSDHRFAKPLTETALTNLRAQLTKAERERQGTINLTQQVFADCLTEPENQQITALMQSNQMGDAASVSALSPSALIQAATAGLIPKDVLTKIMPKLKEAIALQLAVKTDGVGVNAAALAAAIAISNGTAGNGTPNPSQPVLGLPQDLSVLVPQLQSDLEGITAAIVNQELAEQSSIFTKGATARNLYNIAGCGLKMRLQQPSGIGSDPPEWKAYFDDKLKDKADDPQARESFITQEINQLLG
ncbi:MAG: hypothetical protein HC781_19190 [Leptolyngbyaceae cyanobacterium CSU_1_4]|nr:hypothetical protein [Leptolyngbyaceae cyanobacterium CSU_1_4]